MLEFWEVLAGVMAVAAVIFIPISIGLGWLITKEQPEFFRRRRQNMSHKLVVPSSNATNTISQIMIFTQRNIPFAIPQNTPSRSNASQAQIQRAS
jgi:hypothetical protein